MTSTNQSSIDTKAASLFEDSFYNWLLNNGLDLMTKGSELMSSELPEKWIGEVDPVKLKQAISNLITERLIEELERITGDRDGQVWYSMGAKIDDDIKLEVRIAELNTILEGEK